METGAYCPCRKSPNAWVWRRPSAYILDTLAEQGLSTLWACGWWNLSRTKFTSHQYGGLKGNSISHYLIEFLNFILSYQDRNDHTAVLAVLLKSLNCQNNLIITKLSDMGVPAWLLRIVISFPSDRKMRVKYKGNLSSVRFLPGGGPQGTLLGLLLFIVLINDVGFVNQVNNAGDVIRSKRNMKAINEIHLKYVCRWPYPSWGCWP